MERVPALAESLGADQVVLTTPAIGFARFRTLKGAENDLLRSLTVPILIFGVRQDPSPWTGSGFRRILLPITLGPHLGFQLRFACRFARRHRGRVTVLHVFESGGKNERTWERTPVAVEGKLPISELKREGILCPLEITVCEGYPARKILSFNENRPHDLIIMGGPSRSNSIYSMGHSLAEAVIAEARCPVLMLGSAIGSDSVSVEPIPQVTLA